MDIVTVSGLKKTYGDFEAVKGIDFSIQSGEIFGFLGPNGAGKTSTINMLIGLSRPTEGDITIGGVDARRHTKKAQALMGIVADESNLYDDLDGFGNLCFCGALYGMRKAERETRARELLAQFNLEGAGKRPFKAYSKGMRRKLAIAAGIIHSPSILFLDEPTTGIDVESARSIRDFIVELKNRGTTVFITTHYIEDAERICDRIAFIVGGKIVASGTVPQLMAGITHGHTLRLSGDSGMAALASTLEAQIPGCTVQAEGDNALSILSEAPIPLLPVAELAGRHGIRIFEAREARPTLEDVFVQITGIDSDKLRREKEQGGGKK